MRVVPNLAARSAGVVGVDRSPLGMRQELLAIGSMHLPLLLLRRVADSVNVDALPRIGRHVVRLPCFDPTAAAAAVRAPCVSSPSNSVPDPSSCLPLSKEKFFCFPNLGTSLHS
ncbi:Hypothetical protein NTJ_00150 [Nesidiocoris tenuis]|uniref:Uncharacterized protein n=1 Tax=Nesidiocoris tenuis TaxID=355587 RepID=A0ABN7A5A0_9HEMI|nr:Hypothetical protein NTJ_00150 [Nesidiocoris tenuis]